MNLTAENYFSQEANRAYFSVSQFKSFLDCEAMALAEISGEYRREETTSLLVGSYVDAHFSRTLDLFRAQHPALYTQKGTLKSEFQQAEEIIARIERDHLASLLLEGDKQTILTGEIEGVPFKCKPDILLSPVQCAAIAAEFPDMYYIRNVWLDAEGKEMATPEGVEPESGPFPVPLFQIIRPNTVNSKDPDSPMGMSIYGAAIDQLKAVDLVYDSYVNEFQLGKKRLMVPMSFTQQAMQDDGTYSPIFDPNDLIYNVYQVGDNSTDKLQPVDMELRAEAHEQGLQRMIDLLSKRCGLGTGRFKFDRGAAQTATQVISEDSDLYQSVKRHEKPLERAIIGMVRALSALSGGNPNLDVTVEFDDSIFEDTGTTIARNIQLVTAGLRSKKAAIMEIAGCDEKEAEKRLQEIASEQMIEPASVDAMFSQGEAGQNGLQTQGR